MSLIDKIKGLFGKPAEKEDLSAADIPDAEDSSPLKDKLKISGKDREEKDKDHGDDVLNGGDERKDLREIRKDIKEEAASHLSDMKTIVDHVIEEDEKTFSNYINPRFWLEKRKSYKTIRKKEKIGLGIYEVLATGARPTTEYYVLTVLSCIIATTGLIQGSTATIIGAMIVAPLMTPILAFSLGVIWGDLDLIRISTISIFKGIIWAVLISFAIAYIIPLPAYSREILSRIQPSLFDVLVALASGIVGAYGYANEKISSTLVGIAIAVALMPPLCIVGIGLGTFNKEVASGAFVLFIINLISIGLAGAVVFWLMKIHPPLADEDDVKKRALYQILISVFILLIISAPLSVFMYNDYQRNDAREYARMVFKDEFPEHNVFRLDEEKLENSYILTMMLTGGEKPDVDSVKRARAKILRENPIVSEIKVTFMKTSRIVE